MNCTLDQIRFDPSTSGLLEHQGRSLADSLTWDDAINGLSQSSYHQILRPVLAPYLNEGKLNQSKDTRNVQYT